jgi:hypothetical protein
MVKVDFPDTSFCRAEYLFGLDKISAEEERGRIEDGREVDLPRPL